MLPRLGRAAALAGLLVLPVPAWSADPPATEEGQALDVRRLSPEQRARLLAGDTIAYELLETSEIEVSAGVAMYLAVPLGRAAEVLTSPDVVLKDPSITASGLIPARATPAAVQGFMFTSGELGEAREALEAEPGLRFNLTPAESEAFRAAKAAPRCCDRTTTLETAASQWRALLLQRAQAFQARGLDGVAPYARRGGISDPAALLRVAAGDARIVAPFAPGLSQALLRYPAEQSPTSISQIYWVKRQVQGRPTPILIHHLVDVTPALALYVERQVYVGHTYNASQILCAAVPYEDGVLILSSNRVSTDQVGGFGGDMKRMIGRRQLRAEIVKRFHRIRAALASTPAPPAAVQSP
ncbi:MAG TPA: hypothetical protein VL086_10425 [Candidatus Nitrosotalea sp.]|jgi:hypothetical protein|nr:hypothetical protein [Candidatus Nitrosotalea sp.]